LGRTDTCEAARTTTKSLLPDTDAVLIPKTTTLALDARHTDTATHTTRATCVHADQDTHTTTLLPLAIAASHLRERRAAAATHETVSADTGLAGTTMPRRSLMRRP
jgi:hypothetical protein